MNVFEFLEDKKPMIALSEEEERIFAETHFCHICKKGFTVDQTTIRVRDHCNISSLYCQSYF